MENQNVEEIKSKKIYLRRYRKIISNIERLEDKLRLLDERMTTVRSPNLSGMPRGGVPVTSEDMVADKMDLENRIKRLKRKSRKIREEILAEIDNLEDSRYCEVLETYFIDMRPLEYIAEQMGYTERHIYTLYKEALSELVRISK